MRSSKDTTIIAISPVAINAPIQRTMVHLDHVLGALRGICSLLFLQTHRRSMYIFRKIIQRSRMYRIQPVHNLSWPNLRAALRTSLVVLVGCDAFHIRHGQGSRHCDQGHAQPRFFIFTPFPSTIIAECMGLTDALPTHNTPEHCDPKRKRFRP